MTKHKSKFGQGKSVSVIVPALLGLGLLIALLTHGYDAQLLNPKGLIAQKQLNLMRYSVTLMLALAIPTLFIFYSFAWKYRETNQKTAEIE